MHGAGITPVVPRLGYVVSRLKILTLPELILTRGELMTVTSESTHPSHLTRPPKAHGFFVACSQNHYENFVGVHETDQWTVCSTLAERFPIAWCNRTKQGKSTTYD